MVVMVSTCMDSRESGELQNLVDAVKNGNRDSNGRLKFSLNLEFDRLVDNFHGHDVIFLRNAGGNARELRSSLESEIKATPPGEEIALVQIGHTDCGAKKVVDKARKEGVGTLPEVVQTGLIQVYAPIHYSKHVGVRQEKRRKTTWTIWNL